jgi:hypothetical protein
VSGRDHMTRGMLVGALAALLVSAACTGAVASNPAGTPVARTDGRPAVPCGPTEVLVLHHHAHLTVVVRGVIRDVPALVGIKAGSICWLHTHDATGVIHIEAGDSRPLTLGDFFALWGTSLGPRDLAGQTAGAAEEVRAAVNGLAASGDPRAIVLNDMDEIVLQLGPPYATVPPYFRK